VYLLQTFLLTKYDLDDHVACVEEMSLAYGEVLMGKDLVVRCVDTITMEVVWRCVWNGFMWLMMGKSG
jgi:hypothetical protein